MSAPLKSFTVLDKTPYCNSHTGLQYRVIAVVEYTLNTTSIFEDADSLLQHIVDLIDGNKDMFEQIYGMKSVKSGNGS